MTVLFLGPPDSRLVEYLRTKGEEVVVTTDRITLDFLESESVDFLVSYGYRHKILPEIVARYRGKAINLHISYLPWNRGADPNFWSWLEDTPKGVTIHYIDEGIDTGPIIVQEVVEFPPGATLRTSYEILHCHLHGLFRAEWPRIRWGKCSVIQQQGSGSFHRVGDKERFPHLLALGWDTPVALLEEAGRRMRQKMNG